jgi:hypothetical protein
MNYILLLLLIYRILLHCIYFNQMDISNCEDSFLNCFEGEPKFK